MAPRRDTRTFGSGPYLVGLRKNPKLWGRGFPYGVPAVEQVEELRLDQPVTLLAGDNGTGKSTLIEAIAEAVGFAEQGGELQDAGSPGDAMRGALQPVLTSHKPRGGFFLRAESFFNVAALIDRGARGATDLSLLGDVPLHHQSHGQSFLALASNRFGADRLYVLDEPEAALSATGALALLAIVTQASRAGAQFVIATHSPILLAIPDAVIYELDDDGVRQAAYDDLDAVRLTRGFLDAPERYLRAALDD